MNGLYVTPNLFDPEENKLYKVPLYTTIDGDIPTDLPDGALISITREQPLKIYNLGFQPAKSIPEIPRWFLRKYADKEQIILEPFAGSGTTIIESIKFGAGIYWLDFHPLSQLICKVKTSIVDLNKARNIFGKIMEKARNQNFSSKTVDFSNKDFWFQESVQEALEILRFNIFNTDMDVQNILLLALSSTVRKASNMNEGMILAARRINVKEIPIYTREDVYGFFQFYFNKIVDALEGWYFILNKAKIINEIKGTDARILNGDWKCDAIITSPPYINAMDYVWASKFELHWLGFVDSNEARLELSSKEIGTERVKVNKNSSIPKTGYELLDSIIKDIELGKKYKATKGQNLLRATVTYQYFMDMKEHFKNVYGHITPGGYYCFAIGENSTICGVDIPVASLLTTMAIEVGLKKIFTFNILLKNRRLNIPRNVKWANVIKHDSVVVLQKPI